MRRTFIVNYYNYFTEIEEAFVRRRGKNLLLSPLDWALIEGWQERGVPLHIVLRCIEKVFDGVDAQPHRKRTVKSLSYCKEEVEAQYAEWLEMQIGKSEGELTVTHEADDDVFSERSLAEHIERVTASFRGIVAGCDDKLRETFERVLVRLEELEGSSETAEQLEETLGKLDDLIDDTLVEHLATDEKCDEIAARIASYKDSMDREAYARTFGLMLRKHLREEAEIPRLSLFYL